MKRDEAISRLKQHEADLKRLDDAVRDVTEALMRRGACLYQPSFQ
jgi:hypothetical protein